MSTNDNKPEPKPVPNDSRPVWEMVMDDMRGRDAFGLEKYKTRLQCFNGRNPAVDKYQELLDYIVYAKQDIEERRQIESGFVADALRTEPEYGPAVQRLQDERTVRLLHVAMGLCTEAGEFLDILKKHIFYGRPIDETNAVEEIGDVSWYQRIGCDALEISFAEMLLRNVRKLRARFPEKFTEKGANERDLAAERSVFEGQRGVVPTIEIDNCMDCPHHSVRPDPDPDDWFCDDDEKVVCEKVHKLITSACRPYRKRAECKVPSWCPLGGGKKA